MNKIISILVFISFVVLKISLENADIKIGIIFSIILFIPFFLVMSFFWNRPAIRKTPTTREEVDFALDYLSLKITPKERSQIAKIEDESKKNIFISYNYWRTTHPEEEEDSFVRRTYKNKQAYIVQQKQECAGKLSGPQIQEVLTSIEAESNQLPIDKILHRLAEIERKLIYQKLCPIIGADRAEQYIQFMLKSAQYQVGKKTPTNTYKKGK